MRLNLTPGVPKSFFLEGVGGRVKQAPTTRGSEDHTHTHTELISLLLFPSPALVCAITDETIQTLGCTLVHQIDADPGRGILYRCMSRVTTYIAPRYCPVL